MTELTPLYMDINNAYSGDEFGVPWRDAIGEGVVGVGDLAVTAGSGNSINIAAGSFWCVGDTNVNLQPTYRGYNDGVINKGITPDPSNPRFVLVVAQIEDAGFSGTQRRWTVNPIHGTPAPSPAVPAIPASALPLCTIQVPAAAASSAAYTFTDLRVRATIGGGQIPVNGLQSAWVADTPTWTSTGTAPALGNGILTRRWAQIGKTVFFQIFLQIGSTTTIGTLNYRWGLPVAAQANQGGTIGQLRFFDQSVGNTYVGFTDIVDANNVQGLTVASPAGVFNAAVPVVPAVNDTYFVRGQYEAA